MKLQKKFCVTVDDSLLIDSANKYELVEMKMVLENALVKEGINFICIFI